MKGTLKFCILLIWVNLVGEFALSDEKGNISPKKQISSSQENNSIAVCGATAFWLSEAEKEKITLSALKGDKNAAFRIYLYYALGPYNERMWKLWLLVAVKLKHQIAEHNLKSYKDNNISFTPKKIYFLNDSDIKKYEMKTTKDSGESAFWLYLYYHSCTKDMEKAERWRQKAIQQGVKIVEQVGEPEKGE